MDLNELPRCQQEYLLCRMIVRGVKDGLELVAA